jgi:hypothetical protein
MLNLLRAVKILLDLLEMLDGRLVDLRLEHNDIAADRRLVQDFKLVEALVALEESAVEQAQGGDMGPGLRVSR